MAVQTGRTVGKYSKVQVKDSGGTLRDIPVTTISGVGLSYPEVNLTALQDAVQGSLPAQPAVSITITGPWDTTAVQAASATTAAAALSGSHTVLNAINGLTTPLTFAFYQGVRHYWEAGEPVWGIASSTVNGVLLFEYTFDPVTAMYSATFHMSPGSAAPAWGTAALA
jgi:hypothetical protein